MEQTHSSTKLTLSAISLYPLKGAGAVAAQTAEVTPRGLEGDRLWMVVDDQGRFISQRSHPGLAIVKATLAPEGLVLASAGRDPVTCPIPTDGPRSEVEVWRDTVEVAAGSVEASHWLTEVLGMPSRLVFQDRPDSRPISSSRGLPGETVSFADGFPVLLCSEASLADLNGRLSIPVPMDRFRPNLVISGSPPFAEDDWHKLTIGGVTFRNAGPCARCTVTTVNQATGQAGPEPLQTLATYRRQERGVMFGVNLVPVGCGTVAVGAPLIIHS